MASDEDIARDRGAARFFANSERYLRRNPEIRIRADILRDVVHGIDCTRMLDLGCGNGAVTRGLLHRVRELTLVDRSPSMIESARQAMPERSGARVDFVISEIDAFHAAAPFDVVVCFGVLAHADSFDTVIQRAAESTATNGVCVFQVTDGERLLARALRLYTSVRDRLPGGRHYKTRTTSIRDLIDVATRMGLEHRETRRYLSALPGSRIFPTALVESANAFLASNPVATAIASEAIVVFQKTGPNASAP